MAYPNQLTRRSMTPARALTLLAALLIAGTAAGAATAAPESGGGQTTVNAVNATTILTAVSSNWSGYVVAGTDAATAQPATFSSVSGTWVQPAADCTTSTAGSTASAFWVGLGGDSETSNGLEQTGTGVDCTANGTARYSAWYELVPAASVKVNLKVAAGDRISASVTVDGTKVVVQLKNLTRGTSFSKTLTMASPDTSSAEWIAEAPSVCFSSGRCQQTVLTNFGTARFSNATAASNGHTGTISDAAWTATAIQLETQGRPGGFDRYAMQVTAAQALPTALKNKGRAFSVKWQEGSSSVGPAPADQGGFYPGY